MRLFIVCAGNTCRSPMVGGLIRKIARDRSIVLDVRTAGVAHHPGGRVEAKAVKVMAELGIDISDDYSKPVTIDDIDWADAIVCVDRRHSQFLAETYPWGASKIHSLESDVQDPYSRPLSEYRKCRDQLHVLLHKLPIWKLAD